MIRCRYLSGGVNHVQLLYLTFGFRNCGFVCSSVAGTALRGCRILTTLFCLGLPTFTKSGLLALTPTRYGQGLPLWLIYREPRPGQRRCHVGHDDDDDGLSHY